MTIPKRVAAALVLAWCPLGVLTTNLSAADEQERVRAEFAALAPYLSMDGEIVLELLDVRGARRKLARIREYATTRFSSHPTLERVGNRQFEFLLASERRIIPVLRAQEFDFEQVVAELGSRLFEHIIVRQWQLETDEMARSGYSQLMPFARELAGQAQRVNMSKLTISYGERGLELTHDAGPSLTNVTLAVTMRSLLGESSTAYYFQTAWDRGAVFQLRVPADWARYGPTTTTRVDAELLSDQVKSQGTFELYNNVPRAIELELSTCEASIAADPVQVVRKAKSLRTVVVFTPAGWWCSKEQFGRIQDIRAKALRLIRIYRKRLLEQIHMLDQQREKVRKSLRKKGLNPVARQILVERAAQLDEEIEQRAKQRSALTKY